MSCYHPLLAVPCYGLSAETGKQQYKIIPYDEYTARQSINGVSVKTIPCGKCLGCRIKKSHEWANRLMLESYEHQENWFVTLTYNDDNIPWNVYVEDDKEKKSFTLRPDDLQKFIKRLRRYEDNHFNIQGIKFYAAGEYGLKSMRPHYHVIFFGLHLPDLIPFGRSDIGDQYYRSPILEKLWPFGFVGVAKVTRESCAYVARYTLKKLGKNETNFYTRFNIVPEFSRMSLRPAIGYEYYQQHKDDIYKNDELFLHLKDRGLKVRPPGFFDKKFEIEYPDKMKSIKEFRQSVSENIKRNKMELTSKSYLDLLHDEEVEFKNKVKKLKRGEC